MKGIEVRQAVLTDIDNLAMLFDGYRQFYGKQSDLVGAKNFLIDRFNHGESVLFIALNAGVPLGFVQLYPSFSSVSMARTYILNDLFVSEDSRKNGIGSQLVSAAVEYAKNLGAIRLTLSTATTNNIAQSVYTSLGWKKDEQFYVYHFATTA